MITKKHIKPFLQKALAFTLALALALTMLFTGAVGSFAVAADLLGDGSPAHPLQIGTEADLLAFKARIGAGEIDLYAELTADIEVASVWTSIGSASLPYVGVFDGKGHTLALSNNNAPGRTALFDTIGTFGMVKNLNLTVHFKEDTQYLGYLAGVAVYNYGTIAYVTVDGSIESDSSLTAIAGIVSVNAYTSNGNDRPNDSIDSHVARDARLLYCVNKATITATYDGGGERAAGIAAFFSGEMRYCYNEGTISGYGSSIIGLAGTDEKGETLLISDSYNAGTVMNKNTLASNSIAGLLGPMNGFKHGTSDETRISGVFSYGTLSNATGAEFAKNPISTTPIGEFYGVGDINYNYDNVYYLNTLNSRLYMFANGTAGANMDGVTSISDKTAEEFASPQMAQLLNGRRAGADAPWEYVPGNLYPTLKAAYDTGAYDPPEPVARQVYRIGTAAELRSAAAEINAAGRPYFGTIILTADIDLSGQNWTPIAHFAGTFDGEGHTISNMTIVQDLSGIRADSKLGDYPGFAFFGKLERVGTKEAAVRNVRFTNASVTAARGTSVSTVAGILDGTIENVYVQGSVTGVSNVGGVVGSGQGVINKVGADVNVTGAGANIGGLAGSLGSTLPARNTSVSDIYSTGSVTSSSTAATGGLFGTLATRNGSSAYTVTISNAYTTSVVTPTPKTSGNSKYVGTLQYGVSVNNIYFKDSANLITGSTTETAHPAYVKSGSPTGLSTIVAKTTDEFKILAATLNGTRTGGEAPWEDGTDSPTLKFSATSATDTGIRITSLPAKTRYVAGQSLDLTGLTVAKVYSNGNLEPVTSYTTSPVSGAELAVSDTAVTVSLDGYPDVSFSITVSESAASYSVSVVTGGAGSVTEPAPTYAEGDTVALTATPAEGSHFVRWTVKGAKIPAADLYAAELTFTMPRNAVSITAQFALDVVLPLPEGIDAAWGYGGEITGAEGMRGIVTATEPGYVIDEIWVDGVKLTGAQGETTYTTGALYRSVFATFAYTVNFNTPANGTLSVSRGDNTLTSGAIVYAGEILTVSYTGPDELILNGFEQTDVTDQYKVVALRDAPPSIAFEPVNKDALDAAITAANALRQSDYTAASWAVFANALTAAQGVLTDADATQAEVNTATATLTAARNALVAASSGGSYGGSSNGSGTTTTPQPTPSTPAPAPQTAAGETSSPKVVETVTAATAPATVDESGKATTAVTAESVTSAVADAKAALEEAKASGETNAIAEVKIEAKAAAVDASSVKVSEVAVPAEAIKAIAEAKDIILTVESDISTVTIDTATLTAIADAIGDGDTVTLTAAVVDNAEALNAKQQDKVGDNPVIELNISVGDTAITTFGGNVTVSVPYTPSAKTPAEDYDLLTVYYLDDDGNITEMKGARYDAATGEITFTTTHFSKFFVSEWISPFTDIAKGDWFYKSARFAYSNELIAGTAADKFSPQTNLTRAMLVTILWRQEGSPAVAGAGAFDDVKAGQWYSGAIAWASANGIVSGVGNNKFAPNSDVTREQTAAILYNYAKYKKLNTADTANLAGYSDADRVSSWAADAIAWANAAGILTGTTPETLAPQSGATRAQAAAFLQRFIENVV